MTTRAIFNGVVVAESRTRSLCLWKGIASYYTVSVSGISSPDAAWTYMHPSPLARRIKNRVAFWPGVQVQAGADETPDEAG